MHRQICLSVGWEVHHAPQMDIGMKGSTVCNELVLWGVIFLR